MVSFDEFFEDSDAFNNSFMKRMQKIMKEIDEAAKSGRLKGKWDINQIDRPSVKGFIIQGHFRSDQPSEPLDPFNPFEPLNPRRRRPMPKRPFEVSEDVLKELREPLTDVYEEEKLIKIYVEVPGEEKDDIQLNIAAGKAEVKAKNFYKVIDLPTNNVNFKKVTSKYKNGVLEITIPKRKKAPKSDKHKIKVE